MGWTLHAQIKQGDIKMVTEKKKGRWKAGESGNPTGRPPGVGVIGKLRNSIAAQLPDIVDAMLTRAKAGDAGAARLLLERVLPPMKATEQPVELSLPSGAGLTAQGEAIVQAVAAGALGPSQGAALLTGLGALARLKEIDDLERRLTALENGNA